MSTYKTYARDAGGVYNSKFDGVFAFIKIYSLSGKKQVGTQTNVDFPKEVMIKGWGWGGKVYSMGDSMGRANAVLEEPKDILLKH